MAVIAVVVAAFGKRMLRRFVQEFIALFSDFADSYLESQQTRTVGEICGQNINLLARLCLT
jgi:hypothetical protein